MDVIMRLVNVKNTGREEFQGVYHVQGYVGMEWLWGRRNVIQVQDVQVIIVDVEQDGILIHNQVNHVIHSVVMDIWWVQNNVR